MPSTSTPIIEIEGFLRPAGHVRLFTAEMAAWPDVDGPGGATNLARTAYHDWVLDNDAFRRDVLRRLAADGPLPPVELDDTSASAVAVDGLDEPQERHPDARSDGPDGTGGGRGSVGSPQDVGPRRAGVPRRPFGAAGRGAPSAATRSGCGVLGIARPSGPETMVEPVEVGETGVAAVVDGVAGTWRVDPEQLDRVGDRFRGRTAFVGPFDRLVADRVRLTDLFQFEYVVEMYKPAAQRRWGYYALPILDGDTLIGKLDATADRKSRRAASARGARGRTVLARRASPGLGRGRRTGSMARPRGRAPDADGVGGSSARPSRFGTVRPVRFRASEVATATGGRLVGADVELAGASFDSRSMIAGSAVRADRRRA